MATYRQIHVKIWSSPDFEVLDWPIKLLFIYLFSNSYRNEAALYPLTIRRMANETGMTEEQVKEGLKILAKHEMVYYDWDTSEVWVVNALKYQNISPQGIKAITKDLEQIKSEFLKQAFITKYNDILAKEIDENHLTITQIIAIRDNFVCQYCGKTITEYGDATVDHIIPQSRGGKDTYENLVLACKSCNSAKGNRTAKEFGYPDLKGKSFHIAKIPGLLKDPVLMGHFRNVFMPKEVFKNQNAPFTVKGKGKGNVKGKGKDNTSKIDLSNNAAAVILTGEGCGEGENSGDCGGENKLPEENKDESAPVTRSIAAVLQKCGILMPSPLEVEKIAFWLDKGIEFGAFELAAEKAALANVRRASYIESILRRWFDAGILTREQAEAEAESHGKKAAPVRAGPPSNTDEEKPWYFRESRRQKLDFRLVEALKEALGDGSAD